MDEVFKKMHANQENKLSWSVRFVLYPAMKGFSVLRNAFDVPPKVELLAVQSSPRLQSEMFISQDKAVSVDVCAALASSTVLYIKLRPRLYRGLLGKLSGEKIHSLMSFGAALPAFPLGKCRWACLRSTWRRRDVPDTSSRWIARRAGAVRVWQICSD